MDFYGFLRKERPSVHEKSHDFPKRSESAGRWVYPFAADLNH
jgi:hypothetical protein